MSSAKRGKWRTVRALLGASLATASVLGTSCGPMLSTVGVVESLRILGLRKSAPYARPGEVVRLELLWDGPKRTPVQRFFGFFCVNPPNDRFELCLQGEPSLPPRFVFNEDTFELKIPEDAVRPQTGNETPYGLAVVFYGVCAGRFTVGGEPIDDGFGGAGGLGGASGEERNDVPTSGTTDGRGHFTGLPVCIDDDGEPVGSEGFVVGYSQIFVYPEFRNPNPRILDFRVNGRSVQVDCYDEECVGRAFEIPDLDGCAPGVACFQACSESPGATCEEERVFAVVDPDSVDLDEASYVNYGREIEESQWVSYFTDRGGFTSELRLVNDSASGFNADHSTGFLPPSKPGPVRIWAVVRDNRGGASWARISGYVEPRKEER
jgi:hypothetical protein